MIIFYHTTAANSVNPDPFVLQTYKSTMCFLTSFLVLLLGEQYKFSPYGLISGLLWVTGGVCGIFGIRNSGLGIIVGTWSAVTVLVSFTWGIFMFGERVVSVEKTIFGIFMMISGVVGMTYFSSPQIMEEGEVVVVSSLSSSILPLGVGEGEGDSALLEEMKQPLLDEETQDQKNSEFESGHTSPITVDENESRSIVDEQIEIDDTQVLFIGMKWNRRRLGILGAVMDGILGGGNLIPMHYSAYHGQEYIISFATGAMIVTIIFWFIRWGYNSHEQKSIKAGYQALPSMHLRTLFLPGVLAGTVWSLGNIGQIISVGYLGESIGMSIVQSSMIVSGIIGIVWFQEIKGRRSILFWSLSALVTFVGIIFLSHQHKA